MTGGDDGLRGRVRELAGFCEKMLCSLPGTEELREDFLELAGEQGAAESDIFPELEAFTENGALPEKPEDADAEYELPSYLEDTLRPYQSFGFKWLKTLQMAGFGGILADEMGLGKTVQTIALFLSDQEMGCTNPSMVVCPASLVYNSRLFP